MVAEACKQAQEEVRKQALVEAYKLEEVACKQVEVAGVGEAQ